MKRWLLIIYCALCTCVKAQDTLKVKTDTSLITQKNFDISPQFRGGTGLLYKYLANNIRFPATCLNDSLTTFRCRVYVKFKIDEKGNVSAGQILRGCKYCSDCDKEALRVVASMPAWNPAISNNKAVKSEYCLPISFKVQ
ncbi:MAG: energy transducer TonB [Bacteroidia bacterium]|nr:energy transducer TonB [Bacteroidia bacterium]